MNIIWGNATGGLLVNSEDKNRKISGGGSKTNKNKEIVPLGLVFINKPNINKNNKDIPIEILEDKSWNKLYKKIKYKKTKSTL
jgi:hypothetical protein